MPALPSLKGHQPAYTTALGAAYCGDSLDLLDALQPGSVNLFKTSPPFPLLREKSYGNKDQTEYVEWLVRFGEKVYRALADDGSFVIDLGGAYQRGFPIRSLHQFRLLLRLCDGVGFHLAEEFYWNNPSKLPSPIEWVNKRKIRAKDSVNVLWWLSKSPWPKADVSRVLTPYSERMKKLLEDPAKFYKPKLRPSGHDIGEGFGRDNGGAIPSNLISLPNTESNGVYDASCRVVDAKRHPARFPAGLPEFFIRFLTDQGDIVVDIFAGSNVTGQAAEGLGRRWLGFELSRDYVAASSFRFMPKDVSAEIVKMTHQRILDGKELHMPDVLRQTTMPLFGDVAAAE